ncbi:limonene-1,2-epoxide hydrolase family protein [Mycobacteroides chelonae]|uniref:limonene-1,2-epoxide hydrolase family protein n=1 Tax=Mycobacteroides chelonae TaxID=1774 RepID=UPI0004AB3486|nr:limonene-1,2-epoxide hydrolase family protein [Mycobacteroides chelonae]MBF9319878.1 SnoaL-like domain-containing protein [Mycobacteroides chelonae]OHT73686.1 limonene-1,2-epoxide hydrolase [Mycobacteroides chelonae]OHT76242.1 limonene-1,2-epoxide hydrolase [Mycobacteroides chelonae]OHT91536.1 limonene-1,2-epoxide hydrolase [Mycobacteroides chelonae]
MTDTLTTINPTEIVEGLWDAMRLGDLASIDTVLDENVSWENVGLPAIRGRSSVMRALSGLNLPGVGFDVKIHRITATGNTVMTERTDVLIVGRLHVGFWVCGVFEVTPRGTIALWRDYADVLNITVGFARGLLGIAIPALRPTLMH